MARAAALGAALGAGWGVLARGWMRLVSTAPEFSWSGSLAIVGLAALLGLGVGVAAEARRRGGAWRWLRLAVVPGLVLFAGPGMPLLPAFVVAGPLVARRNRAARVVALVAVLGPPLYVWWTSRVDDTTLTVAPVRAQVALLLGMPLLATLLAMAGHLAWGPRAVEAQSPSPERARSSRRSDSRREAPAGPA
ncbi:MAG: hypothetical protein WB473_00615 [Pedococcus sp.]